MRPFASVVALAIVLGPTVCWAQEAVAPSCEGTCVPDEDMAKFVELLKERRCLQTEAPTFQLDPINIVVDKEGRVFYSGSDPNPYTVRMTWCGYEAEAQGAVKLVAAISEPSVWGVRFRPKAYIGILPVEAFNVVAENEAKRLAGEVPEDLSVGDLWDAGVMVDFFHYDVFNLNAAVGFRSFGGGLGTDLTSTVTVYAGYANTWGTWHHNLNIAMAFALW